MSLINDFVTNRESWKPYEVSNNTITLSSQFWHWIVFGSAPCLERLASEDAKVIYHHQ